MKAIILTILIGFLGLKNASILRGQGLDTHLSQFWTGTSRLNPALSGMTQYKLRLRTVVRSQDHTLLGFKNDYQSLMASADGRISVIPKKYRAKYSENYVGVGIYGMSSKAGPLDLGINQAHASIAYMQSLNNDRLYLSVGTSLGYISHYYNLEHAKWGSQGSHDGNYNPTLIPYDKQILEPLKNINIWDMALGATLSNVIKTTDTREGIGGGLAIYHIGRPYISYMDNPSERMSMRWVVHGAYEKRKKGSWGKNIRMMGTYQNTSWEALIGGQAIFDINDIFNMQGGVFGRFNNKFKPDAAILVLQMNYKSYGFGASYDFAITSVKSSNYIPRGAEINFIWRGVFDKNPCPDFSEYNFTF